MRHVTFSDSGQYPIVFLVPRIDKDLLLRNYIEPYGIDPELTLTLDLHQAVGKKKTPMKEIREYVAQELVPIIEQSNAKYIVCGDGDYFKAITGAKKTEANLGYVMDYLHGSQKVVYVPNYKAVFYDPPKVTAKIKQGIEAMISYENGTYVEPGNNIIHYADYPTTPDAIANWLQLLLEANKPLTVDIEAFSLQHYDAGIATITLCWSEHEGIAFPVDYRPIEGATAPPYGEYVRNDVVRILLRNFFIKFQANVKYHNISYDVYNLIYQLFMTDLIDTEGMLYGIEVMLRNWDCTKLITYLATNTCAGNKLGLKDQSQEFAGNYAEDEIKDVTRIPLDNLLKYNLVDGLATWYVYNKHWDTLVADQQLDVYNNIFKPATIDIIQMQLTGLPVNMNRVYEVEELLTTDYQAAIGAIQANNITKAFTHELNLKWVETKNATYKKKRVTLADANEVFNPNSGPQLQSLLFDFLQLPVISLTDSKQPSTDGDTLKSLLNHTTDNEILDLLNALMDYNSVNKIITSFIPAFKNAQLAKDGWHYLFGKFNLGGTVSGRLSSSDPNLQNLPSGSKYAKLIKSCVQAPPGWIFCGLDFASLEDRISALTTKDPNKLKVYLDGFDGHAMRAVAYFGDQMPDIDPTSVDSVNQLAIKGHRYGIYRQDSKAPTFLLTYGGTYMGLMKNCGFTEEKAKLIEHRYHVLYVVSDEWVQAQLDQAAIDGYVTIAFGLRLRTPLLAQVIRGNSKTPYEAEAEGRTAGNALGQSWCLLNNRAGSEFMGKVRKSQYRLDIRPGAHIHDAQYFLIKDDIDVVHYVNTHLVQAVNWQEHPAIAHPDVHLGGELSLFYPSWKEEIELPNGASKEQIIEKINKVLA